MSERSRLAEARERSRTFSADDFIEAFKEQLAKAIEKHPRFVREFAYIDTENPVRDMAVSLASIKVANDALEKAGEGNAVAIMQEEQMEFVLGYLTKRWANCITEAAQVAAVTFRSLAFALEEAGWKVDVKPSHGAGEANKKEKEARDGEEELRQVRREEGEGTGEGDAEGQARDEEALQGRQVQVSAEEAK